MIRYGRENNKRHTRALSNKENIELNHVNDLKDKNNQQKYMDRLRMIKKVSDTSTNYSQNKIQAFNDYDLKSAYSMHIFNDYSDSIFEQLSQHSPLIQQFLTKHSITNFLRAKMVDWMIEVLSSYKMSEQSFFRSVSLMDQYFKKANCKLETKDIHLIGITCMFISMKYQQIHPLRLSLITEKIGRKKFSNEQILQKQSAIIATLDFNLNFPTSYEIVKFLHYSIMFPEKSMYQGYFQKVLLFLSKMSLFNSEIASLDINLLGSAVYYAGLRILSKTKANNLIPDIYLLEISRVSGINCENIKQTSKRILQLAHGFPKEYPILNNLKKFNSFQ